LGRFVVTSLVFCLVACGEVSETPDDGGSGDSASDSAGVGDFTLSVSPGSIEIPIASSGTVTLNVDRTGTAGDIMLAAQNVPADLQVTFSPATIPASENTSEVKIEVAGGSVPASSTITLVGTSGEVQHTTTVSVATKTITVSGRVHNGLSGITVRIVGKPATTSDGAGNFTFTNVTPPYDIYTVGSSGFSGSTSPAVYYYKGLTRTDPDVLVATPITLILVQASTATVSGTKSGGDTTSKRAIAWSNGGSLLTGTNNAYSFTASWPQAATNSGTLYGLQWTTRGNGAPDTFVGYGSTNATLTAYGSSTVNLTLTAPTAAELTGTITAPSGYPSPTLDLYQQLGYNAVPLWGPVATTAVAATIPLIAAGTTSIHASSAVGSGTDASSTSWVYPTIGGAQDVSFALPPPATLSMPIAAASGVTTTTQFQFSTPPKTINLVGISTSGTMKAEYAVYTTESSITIPNVPELPLPPNQSFTWHISGYGPHDTIDEAADSSGLLGVGTYDFTTGALPHFYTSSASRTFTSAP
jgi:hypothetical protein